MRQLRLHVYTTPGYLDPGRFAFERAHHYRFPRRNAEPSRRPGRAARRTSRRGRRAARPKKDGRTVARIPEVPLASAAPDPGPRSRARLVPVSSIARPGSVRPAPAPFGKLTYHPLEMVGRKDTIVNRETRRRSRPDLTDSSVAGAKGLVRSATVDKAEAGAPATQIGSSAIILVLVDQGRRTRKTPVGLGLQENASRPARAPSTRSTVGDDEVER